MGRKRHVDEEKAKDDEDDTFSLNFSLKKGFALFVGVLFVVSLVAFAFYYTTPGSNSNSGSDRTGQLMGQQFPIEGREHYPQGTDLQYNTNPPTSGSHWPQPAQTGFYSQPLPDEQLVHNLEHGQIWISYKDVDDATVAAIQDFASRYPNAVIATPRSQNDDPIALASWGRLLTMEEWDEATAESFLRANINNAPEPLASA